MLSYRHSFHAGNYADVLKHIVQSLIITSLKEKETPFIYIDTHAGAGRYQLQGSHAQKTGEYLQGINQLWQQQDLIPPSLKAYFSVMKHYNSEPQLRYYPGSPLIAKQLLRPQDKLYLTELHSSDYALLKKEFNRDLRATVAREDGFQQLKSKLPPLCRRGLIMIDPSYELKTDYEAVVQAIREGYKRFSTGIYALWYPVVNRRQTKKMLLALQETPIRRILQIELSVKPDNDQKGMTAAGMIVINPPWALEQQMTELLPWLHQILVPLGTGTTTLTWITPE